jgi:ribosomal protein S18 acetylase RimI-like enzyme
MKISIATEDDIQNIINIIELCIKDLENQGIYQWNDYYPTLGHINESIQDKSLYTIKENKNCLGVIAITENQPQEYKKMNWLDKTGKILVITKLVVNPVWQNQGIGRKLMDFAENEAIEKKYTSIRLDAYSGNPRAINLYEKRGYRKVGEVYFPRRELPFYCYEKLIDH